MISPEKYGELERQVKQLSQQVADLTARIEGNKGRDGSRHVVSRPGLVAKVTTAITAATYAAGDLTKFGKGVGDIYVRNLSNDAPVLLFTGQTIFNTCGAVAVGEWIQVKHEINGDFLVDVVRCP